MRSGRFLVCIPNGLILAFFFTFMLYGALCSFYERIESLSKRLDMTDQLIRMYRETPKGKLGMIVRLTKGEIRPGYEGFELGVAEKLVVKAIYMVTMIPVSRIEEERIRTGDIGKTAESLIAGKKQTTLFHEPLTVDRVFSNLERIASSEGRSSQDLKLKLIADLLHDADPFEAKFITRTVCQKMRIGIADMTQIDAMAYIHTQEIGELYHDLGKYSILKDFQGLKDHLVGPLNELYDSLSSSEDRGIDREAARDIRDRIKKVKRSVQLNRERIVRAYNIHPDLGHIADLLSNAGIDGLEKIKVTPGIPLRAMLGERLPSISGIIEKMGGRTALEFKYDGLRVQAHIIPQGQRRVKLFSRQLEDITNQFPDVLEYLENGFRGSDCILEGECVPVDMNTGEMLPFQVVSQRRGRKYELDAKMEEIPVRLVLFDCLYLDGVDLTNRPYPERRKMITCAIPGLQEEAYPVKGLSLSEMKIVDDPDVGEEFFLRALGDGCEGVMAKSIDQNSKYQAGSRGWLWIKYKKDYQTEMTDTLDLVVVGAYHGTGRRGGTYGALLMAAYDRTENMYRTVCKLGSGFNDTDLGELPGKLVDLRTGGGPHKTVDTKMKADLYFSPFIVLEVRGGEITFSPTHTCALGVIRKDAGLALRFPRFTGRYREDKAPEQATSVDEIVSMYRQQVKTIE